MSRKQLPEHDNHNLHQSADMRKGKTKIPVFPREQMEFFGPAKGVYGKDVAHETGSSHIVALRGETSGKAKRRIKGVAGSPDFLRKTDGAIIKGRDIFQNPNQLSMFDECGQATEIVLVQREPGQCERHEQLERTERTVEASSGPARSQRGGGRRLGTKLSDWCRVLQNEAKMNKDLLGFNEALSAFIAGCRDVFLRSQILMPLDLRDNCRDRGKPISWDCIWISKERAGNSGYCVFRTSDGSMKQSYDFRDIYSHMVTGYIRVVDDDCRKRLSELIAECRRRQRRAVVCVA